MTQSPDAKTTYNKYVRATETVSGGGAVAGCGGSSSESGDATAEESYSVSIEPTGSIKFGSVSEDTIVSGGFPTDGQLFDRQRDADVINGDI